MPRHVISAKTITHVGSVLRIRTSSDNRFPARRGNIEKKPAVENDELLCRYICGRFPSLPAIKKSIEKIGRGNQSTFQLPTWKPEAMAASVDEKIAIRNTQRQLTTWVGLHDQTGGIYFCFKV